MFKHANMLPSRRWILLSLLFLGWTSCTDGATSPSISMEDRGEGPLGGQCDLDPTYFSSTGVVRDGIPALTDPVFLEGQDPAVSSFLHPTDRVIGLIVDEKAYAIPHRILWFHEIANLTLPDSPGSLDLAVTYCPLTGSAMVFDRALLEGAEFGVSGLLYKSNLIMYDRRSQVSLWPQMLGEARCGPATGVSLLLHPALEMTWDGWRTLHPNTLVLGEIAVRGGYERYPYGDYEEDPDFGFPMPPADVRRPAKERVLGLRIPDGRAFAFPFGSLAARGNWVSVEVAPGLTGSSAVVFWDGSREAAAVFHPWLDQQRLTFRGTESGLIDNETGSTWSVEGRAVSGPLAGARLEPFLESFIAFWGAWHAFYPQTSLWGPGKPGPGTSPTPGATGTPDPEAFP